jgi:hypothetical protein
MPLAECKTAALLHTQAGLRLFYGLLGPEA